MRHKVTGPQSQSAGLCLLVLGIPAHATNPAAGYLKEKVPLVHGLCLGPFL
jgi:predicted MFS family arabinose efflux permease